MPSVVIQNRFSISYSVARIKIGYSTFEDRSNLVPKFLLLLCNPRLHYSQRLLRVIPFGTDECKLLANAATGNSMSDMRAITEAALYKTFCFVLESRTGWKHVELCPYQLPKEMILPFRFTDEEFNNILGTREHPVIQTRKPRLRLYQEGG